jgi:hypothetical protein
MVRLSSFPIAAVAGAALFVAAGGAGAGTASAAAGSPDGTGYSVKGGLTAVAATSVGNAWAVGYTGSSSGSLILRWTGAGWSRQAVPAAGGLTAVAASSASNAWAVGDTLAGKTVTLHWNGAAWKRVPSPSPAGAALGGVATTSAHDAWAVGQYGTSTVHALLLHWNGSKWAQVRVKVKTALATETPALDSVSASSASSVWAAGCIVAHAAGCQRGLTLHWDGKAWRASEPGAVESSVAAVSRTSVWTAGCLCAGNPGPLQTSHWNGKNWTSPRNPFTTPKYGFSSAVIAAASNLAWAAGEYCGQSGCTPFLMRWTAKAWKLASFHSKGAVFAGVAVTSAKNAWAVGHTSTGETLILHWNGNAWT